MKGFQLPCRRSEERGPRLPGSRGITLIGANGAGKSRFMEHLIEQAGERAYPISPMTDSFPGHIVTDLPDFIDRLAAEADSVIFSDIKDIWESLFPGNKIIVGDGKILFATSAGDDYIEVDRLSRGEKTALYFVTAVAYAPRRSMVFVDSPSLFLHPSLINHFWNTLEEMRPDLRFIYDTQDASFIGSRHENVIVWIRSYERLTETWDYEIILPSAVNNGGGSELSEELFVDLMGSRRPVLFIEGDTTHSIDYRLYTLAFPEYTVRPLGSCDKVIEATRSFSTLRQYHPLDIHGLVDRDRRTDAEVGYLRQRRIMVPEVAEVENIFLAENVVRVMAQAVGKDPERVVAKVRNTVLNIFSCHYEAQALQHTRHRMKRDVERKIDARFTCITALELHIKGLIHKLRPREYFNALMSDFKRMLDREDYAGILRVFNHKPMLTDSNVARLLGYPNAESYIAGVISVLRSGDEWAEKLRVAIRKLFTPVEVENEKDESELFANKHLVFRPRRAQSDKNDASTVKRTVSPPSRRKLKKRRRRSNRRRHLNQSPDANV